MFKKVCVAAWRPRQMEMIPIRVEVSRAPWHQGGESCRCSSQKDVCAGAESCVATLEQEPPAGTKDNPQRN